VTDDDVSFGLTLVADELNHLACIAGIKENSTADKMYATHRSTTKNVKGACLVEINGKKVFGKDDAVSMLRQLHDQHAENLVLERNIGVVCCCATDIMDLSGVFFIADSGVLQDAFLWNSMGMYTCSVWLSNTLLQCSELRCCED